MRYKGLVMLGEDSVERVLVFRVHQQLERLEGMVALLWLNT